MKLGIMQPYFFPYWGYWQLISSVDKYIIYDDVNYIKGGWINRNYILINGNRGLITLNLRNSSSFKKINEIEIFDNKLKIYKTISQNYSSCSEWEKVKSLIEAVVLYNSDNLADYLSFQIRAISEYLGVNNTIVQSGNEKIALQHSGSSRVIELCRHYSADVYINSMGGQVLYSQEQFNNFNIKLKFLKTILFTYKQKKIYNFVQNLSIIDIICNVDIEILKQEISNFELI